MCDVYRVVLFRFFFFNDTATTEIYTLSLHDALPISVLVVRFGRIVDGRGAGRWSAAASANVAGAHLGILLCRRLVRVDVATLDRLKKQTLKKWAAPATARTGAETLAKLARPARLLDSDKVAHLPLGNVKTEAKFVVVFHVQKTRSRSRRSRQIP